MTYLTNLGIYVFYENFNLPQLHNSFTVCDVEFKYKEFDIVKIFKEFYLTTAIYGIKACLVNNCVHCSKNIPICTLKRSNYVNTVN